MNKNTTVLIVPQPSCSLNVPPPPPLFTAVRPLSPTNTKEYSWVDRKTSQTTPPAQQPTDDYCEITYEKLAAYDPEDPITPYEDVPMESISPYPSPPPTPPNSSPPTPPPPPMGSLIPPPPILRREKGVLMPLETKIAIKAVDRIFTKVKIIF